MRISTQQIQRLGTQTLMEQQSKLSKTQMQLSTGRRILTPADDPVASEQSLQLRRTLDRILQYQSNANQAEMRLNTEEGVLDNVELQLQRMRELAIQAANGTQTNETRHMISAEMRQILDQVIDLSNSTDGNGEYLFSGTKGHTQPFTIQAGGGVSYDGDQTQRFIQIGDQRQVSAGDTGYDVFMDSWTGNSVFRVSAGENNTGSGVIDPGSVTNHQEYDGDTYEVVFAEATEAAVGTGIGIIDDPANNNVLEYRIEINGFEVYSQGEGPALSSLEDLRDSINERSHQTGVLADIDEEGNLFLANNSGSGEPIEIQEFLTDVTDPLVSIDSDDVVTGYFGTVLQGDDSSTEVTSAEPIVLSGGAPAERYIIVNSGGDLITSGKYEEEAAIAFQGLKTKINGTPNAGDHFVVEPSRRQDIFTTLQSMIDAVEGRVDNDHDNAGFRDRINNALMDLDQGMQHIGEVRAQIGARLNSLDGQRNANDHFALQAQELISDLEDLDYAEAISRFNLQMVGLQAAQQTYVKTQGLSLFNYIG